MRLQHRFPDTAPICDTIDQWLPYHGLPTGCIHEVKGSSLASAIAFASLLTPRIPQKGVVLYVAPDCSLYPLGLLPYGVKLEQWIHVSVRRSKDLAWTVLEALRCSQASAVLAVMDAADLTYCRRLQLGAESSGATGFLLGNTNSAAAASVITRWRVSSVNGEGVWAVELRYCRGGRPGNWMATWRNGRLEPARPLQRATFERVETLAG
jgi:protein ImuA